MCCGERFESGRLVLIGSGELSPGLKPYYRGLFSNIGAPVNGALLATPFAFQENKDILSSKIQKYFKDGFGVDLDVVGLDAHTMSSQEYDLELKLGLKDKNFVFSGPGSPSYALKKWNETCLAMTLSQKLKMGLTVTFASAAALTAGKYTIPVYEIYKVGSDLFWVKGLDLFSHYGISAIVVPHFDNAEGQNHDTSHCYIGKSRFNQLLAKLEEDCLIFGIDENTVVTFDFGGGDIFVDGRGALNLFFRDEHLNISSGEHINISELPKAYFIQDNQASEILLNSPDRQEVETKRLLNEALDLARSQDALAIAKFMEEAMDVMLRTGADDNDKMLVALKRLAARMFYLYSQDQGNRLTNVESVRAIADARIALKGVKNFELADKLRAIIYSLGYELRDTSDGYQLIRMQTSM